MATQMINTLSIDKDGKKIHLGTVSITDFNDTAKWAMSPVSKRLGLPLKAHGVASNLSSASESDQHTFINAFFLDYDPYSSTFGKMTRAPYVGNQVIIARCDGLPLDEFIPTAIHGYITALTCADNECASKTARNCPKDSQRDKQAIAQACTKKFFSASLERTKIMMQ